MNDCKELAYMIMFFDGKVVGKSEEERLTIEDSLVLAEAVLKAGYGRPMWPTLAKEVASWRPKDWT